MGKNFVKNCNSSPIMHIFKMKRPNYPFSITKITSHISCPFRQFSFPPFFFFCFLLHQQSLHLLFLPFPFPLLDQQSPYSISSIVPNTLQRNPLFQFLRFVSFIFTFIIIISLNFWFVICIQFHDEMSSLSSQVSLIKGT